MTVLVAPPQTISFSREWRWAARSIRSCRVALIETPATIHAPRAPGFIVSQAGPFRPLSSWVTVSGRPVQPRVVADAKTRRSSAECAQRTQRIRKAAHPSGHRPVIQIGRDHYPRPDQDVLFKGERGNAGTNIAGHGHAFVDRSGRRRGGFAD